LLGCSTAGLFLVVVAVELEDFNVGFLLVAIFSPNFFVR
jgi:hypothetical protein